MVNEKYIFIEKYNDDKETIKWATKYEAEHNNQSLHYYFPAYRKIVENLSVDKLEAIPPGNIFDNVEDFIKCANRTAQKQIVTANSVAAYRFRIKYKGNIIGYIAAMAVAETADSKKHLILSSIWLKNKYKGKGLFKPSLKIFVEKYKPVGVILDTEITKLHLNTYTAHGFIEKYLITTVKEPDMWMVLKGAGEQFHLYNE